MDEILEKNSIFLKVFFPDGCTEEERKELNYEELENGKSRILDVLKNDDEDKIILDSKNRTWYSEKHKVGGQGYHAFGISHNIIDYKDLFNKDIDDSKKIQILEYLEIDYGIKVSRYRVLEDLFSFVKEAEIKKSEFEWRFKQIEDTKKSKAENKKEIIEFMIEEIEEELIDIILNELKLKVIPFDSKPELYYFKDGIYHENGGLIINSLATYLLEKNVHKINMRKIIKHVSAIPLISLDEFFEQPEYTLCVGNGYLDLKTKKLKDFKYTLDDEFHHTKLDWNYNPSAKAPKFQQFVDTLLDKNDVKILQEFVGFCLVKGYPLEAFMIFLGEGKNGKSTLLTILRYFFSMRNITGLSINAFSDSSEDSFLFSSLNKKLLNIAGDAGTKIITGDEIKKLTGNDPIHVNRKFKEPITIVNTSKFITSYNELPYVKDTTEGFWRRCLFIPFKYKFHTPKDFEKLKEKTEIDKIADKDLIRNIINNPEEFSGILNWALEGLDRLEKQKSFSTHQSTEEIKNLWSRRANSFYAFLEEYTEFDRISTNRLYRSQLMKAYHDFCEKQELKPVQDRAIKNQLSKKGIITDLSNRGIYGTSREIYYEGLKLKEPYDKYEKMESYELKGESNINLLN